MSVTPLMLFTLAWIGGILVAEASGIPSVWTLLLLPPALVLLVGWGDRRGVRGAAAMLVALMLGGIRHDLAQSDITADHVAYYRDAGTVEIEGVVIEEPDRRATDTRLRVRVDGLAIGERFTKQVEGRLLVYVPSYPIIHYGDRIRAIGFLETPPVFDDFSFKDYLAREGIHAVLREAHATVLASHQANPILDRLLRLKLAAHRNLQSMLPEPQGALLAGILLGIEQGIPELLQKAFETTGTSHIVAISGFNLTMVAALITRLARRLLSRRGGLPAALLAIWTYVILVGANASVMRAGVMSSVIALGQQTERPVHGPTSLAAATLVLSALNPFVLWDVGFQFSAAAVVGMLIYAPPLAAWITGLLTRVLSHERAERVVGSLNDILIVTLVVQFTTLGITIANFRAIPLVAPLVNFLILPAQPFIMVFGGLALIASAAIWPLAQFFAWLAWTFLAYTIEVVMWAATFPLASLPVPRVASTLVWVYHLGLGVLTLWLVIGEGRSARSFLRALWDRFAALLALIHPYGLAAGSAGLVLLVAYFSLRPDSRLHLVFLGTGRGDGRSAGVDRWRLRFAPDAGGAGSPDAVLGPHARLRGPDLAGRRPAERPAAGP
jgi:competence protein ComEC